MTQTAEERSVTQVHPQWRHLLAGPIVWSVYFLVVYTLGEFGCRGGWLRGEVLGLPALGLVVVLLTVPALGILGWATFKTYRAWQGVKDKDPRGWAEDDDRSHFMLLAGWVLGALFTFLTLLTGLPAVVLPRCG